jgi:outer membrane lipoprotein-sorting protein
METGAAAPICPFCARFRYTIPMRVCLRISKFLLLLSILCVTLALGAFADEGPLDTAKPTGITAEEIIRRFAAKEKEFKDARDQYTFRQSVTVQTVDGDTVTGEYREVFDVQFDDRGKHLENVVFAPQSSLENGGISMSPEDIDDIRHKLPFVLTSEDVGEYDVLYVGQQQEDELHCYVFDIAPKQIQGKKRYFQGRIWVDDKDYQIVKTFGKTVPETRVKKNGKGNENLFPKFTTWREQIDGKYWFPTYTKADDILHFHTGDIHIREIVKYTDYQRFGSNVKITYEGKEVQKDQTGQEKPADSKPEEKPKK